jgi:hypothetical protein
MLTDLLRQLESCGAINVPATPAAGVLPLFQLLCACALEAVECAGGGGVSSAGT